MNIVITATDIDLTDELRTYIEKKFEGVERIIDVPADQVLHCLIEKTTRHHKNGDIYHAECSLEAGRLFVATAEGDNILSAMDEVEGDLTQVLTSYKEKKRTLWMRGSQKIKNFLHSRSGRPNQADKID